MVRALVLLLLSLFFSLHLFSQEESNIWFFGDNAGLDFSNGNPVLLGGSQMRAFEGCAVASDDEGNLLFYTDGNTVWNREHRIMNNGESLLAGGTSTQAAIIVPKPGTTDEFYLFTATGLRQEPGLQYAEIRMEGDNGFGTVGQKYSQLEEIVSEKLSSIRHPNGTDFWVLTHGWNSNRFLAYRVTPDGVNPNPVISEVGPIHEIVGSTLMEMAGYTRFSPDGTKVATATGGIGIDVYDFDLITGKLRNHQSLDTGNEKQFYGLEFSESGRFLYTSEFNGSVVQYDLAANDIPGSKVELLSGSSETHAAALKMGPDGRIYLAHNYRGFLSRINNPEVAGIGANFEYQALFLSGAMESRAGLPETIQAQKTYSFEARNLCLGETTSFQLTELIGIQSAFWDFGDGMTSTDLVPYHTYSNPGEYEVSVDFVIDGIPFHISREIEIRNVPSVQSPQPLVYCYSEQGQRIDLKNLNTQILLEDNPENFLISYHLSLEDAQNGANPIEQPYSFISWSKTLHALIQPVDNASCSSTESIQLFQVEVPENPLEATYVICPAFPNLELDGGDYLQWRWLRNGSLLSEERTFSPLEVGNYSLTISREEHGKLCEATFAFEVLSSDVPENITVAHLQFSDQAMVEIKASGSGEFEYSIDGLNWQVKNTYNLDPGIYTAYVRDKEMCRTIRQEFIAMGYPKFFTPNADNNNDTWHIIGMENYPDAEVTIFDRFGNLMAQLSTQNSSWNGDVNGRPAPPADYWFRFEYDGGKMVQGHFSLKR